MQCIYTKLQGPFAGTDIKPDYSLSFEAKTELVGSGCRGIIRSRGQATNSAAGVTVQRIRTRAENGEWKLPIFQIGYPKPRETWIPLWQSMEPKSEPQFGCNGYGREDRQDDGHLPAKNWIQKILRR